MTVYVSYHEDDRAIVTTLKGRLRNQGLVVIDRHSPDLHWRAAIARCDAFVTFCSARPVNRDELGTALERTRTQPCPILTLKLGDCDVPEGLTAFPALTLDRWDEFVQEITSRVGLPAKRNPRPKKRKGTPASSLTIEAKHILAGTAQIKKSRQTRVKTETFVVDRDLQLTDGDE